VIQEVPFLSKLPLIGELFRSTSTDHRHSEIMVFITPHIVK
jgi:type II secretory pathway component GspD/PulD (secretin)